MWNRITCFRISAKQSYLNGHMRDEDKNEFTFQREGQGERWSEFPAMGARSGWPVPRAKRRQGNKEKSRTVWGDAGNGGRSWNL